MRKSLVVLVAAALLASSAIAATKKKKKAPAATPTAVPAAPAAPAAASGAAASSSGLVSTLSSKLGITPQQAEGGAGALFSYAKTRLAPNDFGKVSNAVPGMDGLLQAAPASEPAGGGDALGGLSSVASQAGGALGLAAAVGPAFQKLGLPPETVGKFVPIVVDYVGSKGGASVGGLLGGVLK